MNEPLAPRPCSTPHSAPVAWLRGDPPAPAPEPPNPESLRAAIELILADPEAVAEVVRRAPPDAFRHADTTGTRHDGWTGERMAAFLEVLADTGLISEACRVVGMSREGAYQLQGRDAVFAAAMAAAKARARPVVADGLLERSITGTVEHYYRDGVLVGERRHYESWLGLAVLKRLDKQAEQDRADATLPAQIAGDWRGALDALREGGTAAVPGAVEPKVDKVDIPPPPGVDPSDSVWQNDDGEWMTTFPPPPGFDGHESGTWDGLKHYERACTAEEAELLDASLVAEAANDRAEAEAERDCWFEGLRAELKAAPSSPPGRRSPAPEPPPAPEGA